MVHFSHAGAVGRPGPRVDECPARRPETSEKRQHSRAPVRTLVTVIANDSHGAPPQPYKAWTEDISASGMQFACNEELPPGRIHVRILLPQLEDKIIECEIVRKRRRESTGLLKNVGPRFLYGARFQQVRDAIPADTPSTEAGAHAATNSRCTSDAT